MTLAQREIRKIYAFGFAWMFLPIIPILVPFQLSLGLSMQEIFWVQIFFGVVCASFEVPSGYLCDLWGRKNTLLIGALFWALGFAYLTQINDFAGMLIYEGILALGVSLVSGADVAMLYDWQQQDRSSREDSAQVLAHHQMMQVLAEALAGLLSGLLVYYSFQHVIVAQALAGALPLLAALSLREPPYEKMPRHQHRENMRQVWRHIFVSDPLLRLIFINQTLWSLSTFIMVWIQAKIWGEEHIPLTTFGLLWALSNLLVGITGKRAVQLEKRWGSTRLLQVIAALAIGGYLLSAVSQGWFLVMACMLFPLSRGLTQVILKEAINWRTPGHMRATVLSLNSLFFRGSFALVGPLVGWSLDTYGSRPTLWALAVGFGLAYFWGMRPMLKLLVPSVEAS